MGSADDQLPSTDHQVAKPEPSSSIARILVFNAQHASPARSRRQAEWIGSQQTADLVIITEVSSGPGGAALLAALADNGYVRTVAPSPGFSDYRTVLASRSANLEPMRAVITASPHRSPGAVVQIGGQTLRIVGLYVPSRGPQERRNESKRVFQAAVSSALPGLVANFDGLVVVAGDFNVVEPDHVPHHKVFGSWEYDFYQSFEQAGFTDAYRSIHPTTIEHSWFGRSGNGYRFDHAFVSARHQDQIQMCNYLHSPRENRLTDHAALTFAITLPSA